MLEAKEVRITDIEEFDSIDVVEVLVKAGDSIKINQPLVTLESEKAMMDFPSQYSGVVQKVNVTEGSKVKEGDSIVTLEVQIQEPIADDSMNDVQDAQVSREAGMPGATAGGRAMHGAIADDSMDGGGRAKQDARAEDAKVVADADHAQASAVPLTAKTEITTEQNPVTEVQENPPTPPPEPPQDKPTTAYASPGVRKYARELGVDLDVVQGSGRQQRVILDDVQNYVRGNLHHSSSNERYIESKTPSKPLNFSSYGETEAVELTKIQKLTANNMSNAWQSVPHVTHFDQADVTLLEQYRKKLADELHAKAIKLTPLAFVTKALVATLKQFPQFNASLDLASEKIILKKYFHIGIAVDTPHGLLVPVLRNVDKKTIEQIAAELMQVSDLARQRKLTPKQMAGASMTITSLGNLGGRAFTPIINPPEVAILGVSKMFIQEKVTESGVVQQKLLPLSLSYDHRVINGADAARFCTHLKNVLEDIWKLIL